SGAARSLSSAPAWLPALRQASHRRSEWSARPLQRSPRPRPPRRRSRPVTPPARAWSYGVSCRSACGVVHEAPASKVPRPHPWSDHLYQLADLPQLPFLLCRYHPTVSAFDGLPVGQLARHLGCDKDIGAAVVVPSLHACRDNVALGGLGAGDLNKDLVDLLLEVLA